jgi:uncharacterized protein with PIN domain
MNMITNLKVACQDPNVQESMGIVCLAVGDDPSMSSLLTKFRELYTKTPSESLIEAKNQIIRHMIISEIEQKRGWFQIYAPWGKENCRSCSGTGEIYKFEKSPAVEPCRCDNGYMWVDCGKCDKDPETKKSTGLHTKANGDVVPCHFCTPPDSELQKDPEFWKLHVGQQKKRCRQCLGQLVTKSLPRVLPKIQSTTRCKTCNGLGWFTPKGRSHKSVPFNPVLDAAKAGLK